MFFCYSANQIFQYQPCRGRSMYRPVSQNHQNINQSHEIYDPHDAIMPLPTDSEISSQIQEIANVIVRALGKRPRFKIAQYSNFAHKIIA